MNAGKKDDIATLNVGMQARKMMVPINKSANWPLSNHKTARKFRQIFCIPSFNE